MKSKINLLYLAAGLLLVCWSLGMVSAVCDYNLSNSNTPMIAFQNDSMYCLNESITDSFLMFNNVHNVTLDGQGFTLGFSGSPSIGAIETNILGSNLIIKNIIINSSSTSSSSPGIFLDNSFNNIQIYNTTIIAPMGIWLHNTVSDIISNIQIYNNTLDTDGIGILLDSYIQSNITIYNNNIYGDVQLTPLSRTVVCLYAATNVSLYNNTCYIAKGASTNIVSPIGILLHPNSPSGGITISNFLASNNSIISTDSNTPFITYLDNTVTFSNSTLYYNNGYGKIEWQPPGNISSNLSWGTNLIITQNNITMSNGLNGQLVPSNITLTGLAVTTPEIIRDGAYCNDCTLVSYIGGTVIFNTPKWGNFTIVEELSITINSAQNTTLTTTSHNFNITTDEAAGCVLHLNGTDYSNSTIWIYQKSSPPLNITWGRSDINVQDVPEFTSFAYGDDVNGDKIINASLQYIIKRSSGLWTGTFDKILRNGAMYLFSIVNTPYYLTYANYSTEFNWSQTLTDNTNYTINYTCQDVYGNSNTTGNYWLAVDVPPVITWSAFTGLNSTVSSDPITPAWTTDKASVCAMHGNGITYVSPGTTSHSYTINGYPNGNYTMNVTCVSNSFGSSTTSSNVWVNISDYVNFVAPTKANNTQTHNQGWYEINVLADYTSNICTLTWNGTNVTRFTPTGNTAYINVSGITVESNYTYSVWCNSSYSGIWQQTEQRNIEILQPIPPDTTPPIINSTTPPNGFVYPDIFANTTATFTIYANEPLSDCRYSTDSSATWLSMTDFNTVSGYSGYFNDLLPGNNSNKCLYIGCNDTHGNIMTTPYRLCIGVATPVIIIPGGGEIIIENKTVLQYGAQQFSPPTIFSFYPRFYGGNWSAIVTSSTPVYMCGFDKFKCSIISANQIMLTYTENESIVLMPFQEITEKGYICPTADTCYAYTVTVQELNLIPVGVILLILYYLYKKWK